jgi:hypothetical protein
MAKMKKRRKNQHPLKPFKLNKGGKRSFQAQRVKLRSYIQLDSELLTMILILHK